MARYPRCEETINAAELMAVLEDMILAYGGDIPVFIGYEAQAFPIREKRMVVQQVRGSVAPAPPHYLEINVDL